MQLCFQSFLLDLVMVAQKAQLKFLGPNVEDLLGMCIFIQNIMQAVLLKLATYIKLANSILSPCNYCYVIKKLLTAGEDPYKVCPGHHAMHLLANICQHSSFLEA